MGFDPETHGGATPIIEILFTDPEWDLTLKRMEVARFD